MKHKLDKKSSRNLNNKEGGTILVGTLLTLVLLIGLGIALSSLVIAVSIRTQRSYQNIAALSYAEAVVEKTMWELNSGGSPSCTPNCSFSNAYVTLDITDIDGETKELVAESFVPNYTNYKAKKKVKVKISAKPETESIAFNYAIQAGTGGIEVSGSSEVQGNLYSNGNISVTGSAEVENPGDAWAVGTISEPNNGIKGTTNPGAPSVPLPSFNIDSWKNLARAGGTINGDYSPTNSGVYTDFGPKEITGNMSMSSSGQKVNLLGPLYIQGNLTISGGSWKLDDTFGSNGTIVLVDGKVNISGGAKFYGNSSASYVLFISTNTANTKANPAISYTGSAEGEKLALFALSGAMKLGGSGEIVAMTGQTLFIEGSGEIIYESGLASANFAGGPGGIWTKKSWQELKY